MKAPGGLPREPIPHCGAPAANPHMAGAPFRPTRSDVPSRVSPGNPANGRINAAKPPDRVRTRLRANTKNPGEAGLSARAVSGAEVTRARALR